MFKNHVYGIDLGSNMIKIYSQNSNEILKEKNMIAIRNKDTVLAVGDEAYEIYEKNPTNVKVSSPMLNGMIANISHLEIMLQLLLDKTGRSVHITVSPIPDSSDKVRYFWWNVRLQMHWRLAFRSCVPRDP